MNIQLSYTYFEEKQVSYQFTWHLALVSLHPFLGHTIEGLGGWKVSTTGRDLGGFPEYSLFIGLLVFKLLLLSSFFLKIYIPNGIFYQVIFSFTLVILFFFFLPFIIIFPVLVSRKFIRACFAYGGAGGAIRFLRIEGWCMSFHGMGICNLWTPILWPSGNQAKFLVWICDEFPQSPFWAVKDYLCSVW